MIAVKESAYKRHSLDLYTLFSAVLESTSRVGGLDIGNVVDRPNWTKQLADTTSVWHNIKLCCLATKTVYYLLII